MVCNLKKNHICKIIHENHKTALLLHLFPKWKDLQCETKWNYFFHILLWLLSGHCWNSLKYVIITRGDGFHLGDSVIVGQRVHGQCILEYMFLVKLCCLSWMEWQIYASVKYVVISAANGKMDIVLNRSSHENIVQLNLWLPKCSSDTKSVWAPTRWTRFLPATSPGLHLRYWHNDHLWLHGRQTLHNHHGCMH